MKILGIDPGLQITGYGAVEFRLGKPKLIDAGVIRLEARTSLSDRLAELHDELSKLFEEFHPAICAVEQLYAHYKHPRTAILMAHARGVILLATKQNEVQLKELPANSIKKAVVGHGHAAKGQMQRAVQQILTLKSPPQPPDVADALAAALCCGWNLTTSPTP